MIIKLYKKDDIIKFKFKLKGGDNLNVCDNFRINCFNCCLSFLYL